MTASGSSTITVTWSGSTPTYRELDAQEFSAGSGATWSLDKTGDASNSTETSYNMASLSPTGTGELYFGLAVVGGVATAGSSSGFTYHVDDNGNLVAYDTDVSATADPSGSQSGGTGVDSAAVLIEASGSCGGTTTTTGATTTTTAPTTTTTGATTTTTQPTTTTTSPTTTTTTACTPSITAVGSLAEAFDANTLSVSPVSSGDIEVLAVQAQPESSAVVASVSGGGVSTWSKAIAYSGSATSSDLEIWWGNVTASGSSTITVTWSGSTPTYRELDAQEFSGSGATWSLDKTGDASNSTGTSYNMASLSPTGSGELYFGMAVVGGVASAGSTSGFSYHVDDNANLVAYDPNVSASVDPAGSQSGGTGVDSAAGLIEASGGSCGGTTTTTGATTTTTHPTTTTGATTTTTPPVVSATTPLLWAGQYLDSTTGLYYLRARWYDPGTGQFMSVDPDLAETDQPYAYAGDDPVNASDPSGQDCLPGTSGYLESDLESDAQGMPSGPWRLIHLTRAKPYWDGIQADNQGIPIDEFEVQYNYNDPSLQWYVRVADYAQGYFFQYLPITFTYNVWVNSTDIRYHYRPHVELPSYEFHSSLANFQYNGRGQLLRPQPGNIIQIYWKGTGTGIAASALVFGKESVSIGS